MGLDFNYLYPELSEVFTKTYLYCWVLLLGVETSMKGTVTGINVKECGSGEEKIIIIWRINNVVPDKAVV